jgi:hypothetical protein
MPVALPGEGGARHARKTAGRWTDHFAGSASQYRPEHPGSVADQGARLESGFLTEPPKVTPEQFALLEARWKQSGAEMSHDLLAEVTTPHIASPDVHVDPVRRQIVMYFHGLDDGGTQVTRVATSPNGIDFAAQPEILGRSYMRAFRHDGMIYVLAMPGQFYRSQDGFHAFEPGPTLFNSRMRHSALLLRGGELWVFWTQVGDVPERILVSRIGLSGDWHSWKESAAIELLRPERSWEARTRR